ncbi:uncharacterized protein LOC134202791 [Armigeres subalbatus]|uniref:uncharacterized protein LOC134202791 n=1 Tax=Armigeres subalbatus TaxID=124917 RepID=UPI002ED54A20
MFSPVELADIHLCYGFANCVATAAQQEYARRFPNRRLPNARTFTTTHRRFREGTLFSTRPHVEQPRRSLTPAMENRILNMIRNDPKTSTRRVAAQLPVSHWSVWNVLNKELLHFCHSTFIFI